METSWRGASQLSSQPTLTARAAGRLCRAYAMIAKEGMSGEIYNVCSGQALPMSEVLPPKPMGPTVS